MKVTKHCNYFRAKFGQEISGGRSMSIFTISKSEIDKVKAFKKFLRHRAQKKEKKGKVSRKIKVRVNQARV